MRTNFSALNVKRRALSLRIAALFIGGSMAAGFTAPAANAASGTWLGTTGNWGATGTWSGGIIADGVDSTANFTGVNITANQTITLDTARTIGNITFTDATTSSNNLIISGANTLTLDVTSGAPIIDVTQTSRTVTISSVVAGNDGLTKNGVGILILDTSTNLYSGTTTISAGTLRGLVAGSFGTSTLSLGAATLDLRNNAATGFGRNTTVTANSTITSARVGGGAGVTHTLGTLSIGSQILTVNTVNATSGTQGLTFGAVTQTGAPTYTVTNNGTASRTLLTLASIANGGFTSTFDGTGSTTVTGNITGAVGGITKTGTGVLTLSGVNTYGGNTAASANGGVIAFTTNTAIPDYATPATAFGKISAASGTIVSLPFGGANPITTTDIANLLNGTYNVYAANSSLGIDTTQANGSLVGTVISNANSGANSIGFAKTGANTLTIGGTVNTYTGPTSILQGSLSVSAINNAASTGPLGQNSTINLGYNSTTGTLLYTGAGETTDRTINLNGFGGGGGIDNQTASTTLTFSSAVTLAAGAKTLSAGGVGNVTFSQPIPGTISTGTTPLTIAKTGTGTLTLTGANAATTLTSAGGVIDTGATGLTLGNTTASTIAVTGDTTINGKIILSGAGTAANGADIGVTAAGITLTLNAVIQGGTTNTVDFWSNVTGTTILTGANTWSGSTRIAGQIVQVSSINSTSATPAPSNLGAPTTVAEGTIGLSGGSTLRYTGTGEITNRVINLDAATTGGMIEQSGLSGLLRFTSNFTATGAGAKVLTLQGSTAGTGEIAGAIVDNLTGTNTTGVTKAGTGTWTLSGVNTYTGPTTVSGGNLILTTGSTANSAISINSGGALTVAGNYTAGNTATAAAGSSLTLAAGGILNLANGGVGNFNLVQNSTFAGNAVNLNGGALAFDVAGGGSSDQLDVRLNNVAGTGLLAATGLNAVVINPITGFGLGTYNLINAAGTWSDSNFFLPTSVVNFGGTPFTVSLSKVGTNEVLTVSAFTNAAPNSAFWNGTSNASWSHQPLGAGSATNWAALAAGAPDTFSLPGATTNVTFTSNAGTNLNTTLDSAFTINSLTFTGTGTANTAGSTIASGSGSNALTINAAALNGNALGNGITVNAGSGTNTISANVVLGANQTWTNSSTNPLVLTGNVSGTGLTLTTAGTGAVQIGNGGTTGSIATDVTLVANTNLVFNRSNTVTQGTDFPAAISGTGAVTQAGSGTLILSGTNTHTGNTVVSSGTLNVTGTLTGNGTTTTGPQLLVGTSAGNSILNVSNNISGYLRFQGATVAGANAVYNQTAGTVTLTSTQTGNPTNNLAVAGYGYMNITGGTFKSSGRFGPSNGVGTTGVMYIGNGGTFDHTTGEWFLMTYSPAAATNGGLASVTIGPNGTLNRNGATANFGLNMDRSNGYAVLNIAGGSMNNGVRAITFGNGAGGATTASNTTGLLSLAGGTLTIGTAMANGNTAGTGNQAFLNFAGGTLQTSANIGTIIPAGGANQTFTSTLYGPISNNNTNSINNATQDFVGGLTVDTAGFNSGLANPLVAPSANGVTSANMTITGGTGYIGAPMVQFTGGTLATGGAPATGYALISGGAVTGIVITSPGSYNAAPTVTLTGGGGTGASVGIGSLVPNVSGGLTKMGAGILTLSGANTYTGGTTINDGTVALGANDVLADTGAVTVNSATATFNVATFNEIVGTLTLGNGGSITGSGGVLTSDNIQLQSGSASAILSGSVSGTVTKTTAGTVTLSGASTFLAPINVNAGTIAFAGPTPATGGPLGNNANINLNGGTISYTGSTTNALNKVLAIGTSNGTVDVSNSTGILTISSATSGGGNLIKTGPGSAQIAGTTSLSGAGVNVSAGTLQAGFGTNGISTLTVGAAGNMNFANSAIEALTLANSAGSLTLNGGAQLGFELNGLTNDSIAIPTNLGTALASTSGTIILNFSNFGAGVSANTYNLITSADGGLSGASYALGTAPNGFNYTINVTPNLVSLTTSSFTPIYWRGGQDLSWNTLGAASANWTTDSAGLVDATSKPTSADTVIFSASGTPTVTNTISTTLDAAFTVDSLQFTNVPAGITSVSIAPGTGGSLTVAPLSSSGGIVIQTGAGSVSISAPVTFNNAQTWNVVDASSTLDISGNATITGNVTKTGAGTLTLSGTNSGTGAITLSSGKLNINSATAIGSGQLNIGAGTTIDSTAPATTLTTNNVQNWNGNFTYTGSQDLNLGTGAVTIANNPTVTTGTVGKALTIGGAIGGGSNALTKAGPGTLILNGNNTYNGLTTVNGGVLTLAGANTGTGGVTLTAGTLNINNAAALGTGALSIAAGTTIDNSSGSAIILTTNNAQNWSGSYAFTGSNSLNLGTGAVTLSGNPTVTLNGTTTLSVGGNLSGLSTLTTAGTGNLVLTGNTTSTGAVTFGNSGTTTVSGNLAQTGATTINAGTVTFSGINSYTGATTLRNGTLNANSTTALVNGLIMGDNTGLAGTLNVNQDNTITSLAVNTVSTVLTPNTITIALTKTLTVTGNVAIGPAPTALSQLTRLNIGGGGSFVVSTAAAGTVTISGNSAATANSENAVLDLTGLASTSINTTATGTILVGNLAPTNVAGNQAALLLPTPAVSNTTPVSTLTANTLTVGPGAGFNSTAGQINQLVLGTGLTTLNVNTINVGTGGRDIGSITFANTNGNLTVRGAAGGVTRAVLNIGTGGATTGATEPTTNNLVNLNGHNVDLLLNNLNVGNQARVGNLTNTLNFDTGTLDATSVNLGFRTGTATTTSTLTSTINLAGGTVTFGNVGATGTGVDIGSSTYNQAGIANTNGILNISGTANVTIYNSTSMGAAMRLGTNSATGSGLVSSTLNLTGGTTTLLGNIIRHATLTTGVTSTINLDGASAILNMSGNSIGTAGQAVVFNGKQGTLQNVAQINGGGAWSKTTAGTLILSGANTYSGATTVSAGSLNVTGSLINAALGNLAVQATGTLNVSGTITGSTATTLLTYGTTAGVSTVNVAPGANITVLGTQGANLVGAVSVYNQTGGSVTAGAAAATTESYAATSGYGFMNISGGSYNAPARFNVAFNSAANQGVVRVGGGAGAATLSASDLLSISRGAGSQGELTILPNGSVTFNGTGANRMLLLGNAATQSGFINIVGGTFSSIAKDISFGNGTSTNGSVGVINLGSGTLELGSNLFLNTIASGTNRGYVNFAGGTIKMQASGATSLLLPASNGGFSGLANTIFGKVTNSTVDNAGAGAASSISGSIGTTQDFAGSVTIDTNGFATTTISGPLAAPTGGGVAQGNISITSGGTGYVAPPVVTFSYPATANSTPAAGYALVSGGVVTGIVITSPGSYAAGDTVSVTLTGGGGTGASVASIAGGVLTANTSGGLTKINGGTLNLTAVNTYTGPTTIAGGTLNANSTSALGDGSATNTLIFTGGTLQAGGAITSPSTRGVTLTSTGVIDTNGNAVSIAGTMIGAGGLTKNGNNTLTLTGANTYAGVTTLSAGTINLGVAENAGVSGPLGNQLANATGTIIMGGGTLQYSAANSNDYSGRFSTAINQAYNVDTNSQNVTWATALTSSGGTLSKSGLGTLTLTGVNTYTGATTISGGTLTVDDGSIAASSSITNNAALIYNLNANARTYANAIGGTGTLTKSGTNTLTLTGANNYSGATTIGAGTLNANASAALGDGSATNTLIFTGGTLQASGAISSPSTRGVTLTSTGVIDTNGNAVSIAGTMTGAGGLTKNGNNTLTLTGANNYTGTSTLNAGTINLGVAEIAGTSGPLGNSAAANPGSIVLGGGTLQHSAANTNDYSGRFSTAASQAYNVDTNGQNVTWATALNSAGGTLSKSGTGTLTLSNTNGYTGATTVSGGALIVNGSIASSSGTSVSNGATIGGSGTFGPVTLVSGSTVSPGNSPGTLSTGSVNWVSGANYDWQAFDLANSTPGPVMGGQNFDTWNVTGTLDVQAGFNFNLWSLSGIGPDVNGAATNFNNGVDGFWRVASATTLTGAGNLGSVAIHVGAFNTTSGFTNPLASGTFSLVQGGTAGAPAGSNDVYLKFSTAVVSGPDLSITAGNNSNLFVLQNASTTPASATAVITLTNGSANTGTITSATYSNGVLLATTGQSIPASPGSVNSSVTLTNTASNLTDLGATVTYVTTPGDTNTANNVATVNVRIGNAPLAAVSTTFGPTLTAATPSGPLTSYPNLASNTLEVAQVATSGSPVKLGTTATILEYKNVTGGDSGAVNMAWRTRTAGEAYSGETLQTTGLPNTGGVAKGYLISDVVQISGMDNGSGTTDTFVLQMSYNVGLLLGFEDEGIANGNIFIGWKNGSNEWVNAGFGNNNGAGGAFYVGDRDYIPGTDGLGTFGIDKATSTVWAVLNHEGQFAVIPEPSTLVLGGLALLGFAGVGLRKRRMAKQDA